MFEQTTDSAQPNLIAGLRRWRVMKMLDEIDDGFWEKENRRRELNWAARSRVLSSEEMAEVARWGVNLVIQMSPSHRSEWEIDYFLSNGSGGFDAGSSGSYRQEEKERELNQLLMQQFFLRTLEPRT